MKRLPPARVSRYTIARSRPLGRKKDGKRGRACIGIDIGGTKSLFALLDEDFEVIAEEKLPSHPDRGGLRAFERGMSGALKGLLAESRRRGLEVRVAGVGCAGRIDLRKGVVRHAPNLAFLEGYGLRERV